MELTAKASTKRITPQEHIMLSLKNNFKKIEIIGINASNGKT